MLLSRLKEREIRKYLKHFPAVGITGPRQCGKSTLAKEIIRSYKKAMYLDLENPEDRAKLTDPSLFLSQNQGKLICFDEVQFMPELFMILRSVIDRTKKNGQFLLLGSASPELLKQSSETLAGRIVYTELSPFGLIETIELPKASLQKLWVRGGFPMSFLAKQENISFVWRKNFVRTFLERDLSAFGVGIAPENMRRFWMMCAHLHGQALNLSSLGNSLGITHPTVKHYVDVMVNTYMLRKIEPYYANIDKRLKKSSKIYLADSGLLHTLLNISSINDLMSHPVAGFSWEGFVLSQMMSHLPDWEFYYATTADQAEIDFVIKKGKRLVAIECKLSKAPRVTKGFYYLLADLKIKEAFVVCPVEEGFSISKQTSVVSISELLNKLH
ncbi:MAG: ATP-binding protein [Cyclobacteriaceae bacterium]|jgi:predicted AAA+ superfamily ATPase|nr:ATP-binding protein [Flammeovirgaceae bacterium]